MNDTATSSGTGLLSGATGAFTAIHLVLIALFAAAALAIIVVGIRRRRGQRAAERAFEARVEEAEAEPVSPPAPEPLHVTPEPDPVVDDGPIPAVVAAPATPAPAIEAAPAGPIEAMSTPIVAEDPADGPVTQLKGLGPKVAGRLAELGVTRVGDLAALDDAGATQLDAQLGAFTGRMARDRWVEQARLLAAGDRAGFEAAFGRL